MSTTLIGVGTSRKLETFAAATEATTQALAPLGGADAKLVLVLATTGHDQPAMLARIRELVGPNTLITGCSAEGVISQNGSDESAHALSVMAMTSERITFDAINVKGFAAQPERCGEAIAGRIKELGPQRAKVVLLLPEGMLGDCTAFLRALDAKLPHRVTIAGGTAGDVFKQDPTQVLVTRQYEGTNVLIDSVSAVILGGDIVADVAVSHGCTPIGLPRAVTRIDGCWVHEIDGRPAWEAFKEYLDGDPPDLLSADVVHLCVGEPLSASAAAEYGSDYLIRSPLLLDDDKKALYFSGGLQVGKRLQFTRRDPELVGAGARRAAETLVRRNPERKPVAVFHFDCAGRGRILFGEQTDAKAIKPVQEAIGTQVPWIGFHTFGEIAAIADSTFYHNYTVVLCALYETPA